MSFVEGFADDYAAQPRAVERLDVGHRGDAAAHGDFHPGELSLQPSVEFRRGAAQHPVAGDVGADDLREPLRCEAGDKLLRRHLGSLRPSLYGHRAVADVGAQDQLPAAEFCEPFGERFRFAHGDAAADGAAGACVEYAAQCPAAFDSAAVLYFERGFRRHAFQHGEVAGLRRLGAVEVDHV